ncbi:hypothetical protein ACFW9U_26720 [Rhodococcus aetherivorans]|uniref:hypothetical protein n=1 Tax=Rhodococcus aetherivorans TaxID=191292 RepID=UPI00366F7FC2
MALVRLPRLLADLIGGTFVGDDVRIDLLGDESEVELLGFGERPRHDAVIAAVDGPWRRELTALMMVRHDLLVLGIRPDGRTTWVYEMRPSPVALGALGLEQIRRVVLDEIETRAMAHHQHAMPTEREQGSRVGHDGQSQAVTPPTETPPHDPDRKDS